jgi:hypothetical protein
MKSLQSLIQIKNQGPDLVADSRQVAEVFGIQHDSLFSLIDKNESELEQLGHIRFEIDRGVERPQGGGTQPRFAWLNFDQIAFLLTLTRSTEKTKEFKLRLIIAFREAREKLRPVDGILLSIPEKWQKTFKDDFYIALLQLYGDKFDASENKPSWVGTWTNRFIYEPIFTGLSGELKSRRSAYVASSGKDPDFIRLHQFLEDHAKEDLKDQITKVTTLLKVAVSKLDFLDHFRALMYGNHQYKLPWDDWDEFK